MIRYDVEYGLETIDSDHDKMKVRDNSRHYATVKKKKEKLTQTCKKFDTFWGRIFAFFGLSPEHKNICNSCVHMQILKPPQKIKFY